MRLQGHCHLLKSEKLIKTIIQRSSRLQQTTWAVLKHVVQKRITRGAEGLLTQRTSIDASGAVLARFNRQRATETDRATLLDARLYEDRDREQMMITPGQMRGRDQGQIAGGTVHR